MRRILYAKDLGEVLGTCNGDNFDILLLEVNLEISFQNL